MSERTAVQWAVSFRASGVLAIGADFGFLRRSMFERSSRRAKRRRPTGFREIRLVNASGSGAGFNGALVFAPALKAKCAVAFSPGKAFCICCKNTRQLSF